MNERGFSQSKAADGGLGDGPAEVAGCVSIVKAIETQVRTLTSQLSGRMHRRPWKCLTPLA